MRAAVFLLALAAFGQAPDFEARVVEDSSGNPLASAEVRFRRIGQRELTADLDTDREGRVRAAGLQPGDYAIDISKPNYVTASLTVKIPGPAVRVRLVRFAVISGQVTDSQGKPALGRVSAPYGRTIGGARISILARTDGGFTIARETELDDAGRYRFHDLRPAEYAVALWYDRLKDGSGITMYPDSARPRIFTVAGGEEFRDIDFRLVERQTFQVSGTVQLPKPKSRVSLSLGLPDQPLFPVAQTITNGEDGVFQFDRVPTGTYDLFVAGPDGGYGRRGYSVLGAEPVFARVRVDVTVADVKGLDITLSRGHTLTVKLAGERPPEGCPQTVTLSPDLVEPWSAFYSGKPIQVAYGKEMTIPDLPPGRVRLMTPGLGPGCYQPDPVVADLSGGATTATLRLATAGALRGTLRGARPSEFTVVLIECDPPPDSQARLATPGADGKFAFEGVPPGRYRIAARPTTSDAKSRWLADLSRMIEIQIPGGAPTDIDLPAPQGDRP